MAKSAECPVEVVIIIGGGLKGTRFRPLSLELPKPLFPVAARPIVAHLVEQCAAVRNVTGINLLGYFEVDNRLSALIEELQQKCALPVRYLQEHRPLGTGGGLLHFYHRIMASSPAGILFINGDIYADLPLDEMISFYNLTADRNCTILVTETSEACSMEYGCVVVSDDDRVLHFVEKPMTFVSSTVNCGVYLFNPNVIFESLRELKQAHGTEEKIYLEREILPRLVSQEKLFAFKTNRFWGSIKNPSSVLIANKKYLEKLQSSDICGDSERLECVFVDPSATVDSTAKIGPNVSIGKNVQIDGGVRIRDSILLDNCIIGANSCILVSVLGSRVTVGEWCRIEGVQDPDSRNSDLSGISYGSDGQISTVTVIGHDVRIADEIIVRSSIVLPHKDITKNCRSEVVL